MKIKRTIATKLILYFAAFLLLFAVVVGAIFSALLTRQTTALHKEELGNKAANIAGTLSGNMTHSSGHGNKHGRVQRQNQGGYGAYMQFLDDIAMTDVWSMDSDSQLITYGHGNSTMRYSELPEDAGEVIEQVLNGQIAYSESFSQLLGVKSITAGAPIITHEGSVTGVVLLHAPVVGIDTAISNGLGLMGISMIFALLLAAAAAVLLALHFTKPLRIMKETAGQMAQGDYTVRTNITQKDEIGEVATALDQLAGKLSDASKESTRLAQLRQDFISNISHELRTPVTVIRGSLEALCDGVVSEPAMVEDYHKQMLGDSIFLERLVNDLLELTRLQNTDFPIEKCEINLCDIMYDVARSMGRIAQQKQCRVIVHTELPACCIMGDYGRIRQMLLIVVDNAIKFSYEGKDITLCLTKYENTNVIKLSICDCGVMIASEELPFVFDRFHKSRDEMNKKGTGLGLPIARQIALRHDMELTAESTSEATTFCFTFTSAS